MVLNACQGCMCFGKSLQEISTLSVRKKSIYNVSILKNFHRIWREKICFFLLIISLIYISGNKAPPSTNMCWSWTFLRFGEYWNHSQLLPRTTLNKKRRRFFLVPFNSCLLKSTGLILYCSKTLFFSTRYRKKTRAINLLFSLTSVCKKRLLSTQEFWLATLI